MCLLARLTVSLILASVVLYCFFLKINFQKKINLVITKFEFSVAFLYKSYNSFEKWVVFCGNNSVLVKIRGKLI